MDWPRNDPKLNATASDRLLNTMVDESESLGTRTDSREINRANWSNTIPTAIAKKSSGKINPV